MPYLTVRRRYSSPREPAADVSVRLARGAAIAGRLLDEAGEPVPNANVLVEQLVETGGVRSTRARRAVQTNDIGEYRVGSLPAGVYVVSVVTPPQVQILRTGASDRPATSAGRRGRPANGPSGPVNLADVGRPRIFFPNAATLAEAEAVPVKAGEERPSVDVSGLTAQLPFQDIALAQDRSPTARDANARATSAIRGRVLGATGPLSGAQVRIAGDAIRQLPPAFTDALGQYEFTDLPAGDLHRERQEEPLHRSRVRTGRHFRSGYAHHACRGRTSRSRGHHAAAHERDRRPADRRIRRSDRGGDDSPVSDPVCVRAPAAGRCAGRVELANRRSRTLSRVRPAARLVRARRLRRAAGARSARRTPTFPATPRPIIPGRRTRRSRGSFR